MAVDTFASDHPNPTLADTIFFDIGLFAAIKQNTNPGFEQLFVEEGAFGVAAEAIRQGCHEWRPLELRPVEGWGAA
jgi:hypothetical protein